MAIIKIRGDQLYHISLAIPKALEAMLSDLKYELSDENYELVLGMLSKDIARIKSIGLLTEIQLTGCLEQVETTIVLENDV